MALSIEPFHGEELLAAPPARVLATLSDLEALGACIPGLVSSERVDGRTLRAVVRPGFSFLRAHLRLTVTLAKPTAPASVAIRLAAQGIGVSLNVDSCLRVEARDEGRASAVRWEARVGELSGLIAAVGPTLIRAAADQVIREGWVALRRRLEG